KNHDPQRARAEIRGSNWAAFIGHFDLCFKVRDQRFEQQPHPGLWWRVRSELAMFEDQALDAHRYRKELIHAGQQPFRSLSCEGAQGVSSLNDPQLSAVQQP